LTIDKLRKRFLWYGGNSVRKKYALVAWNIVCKSKMQVGLGVLDLTVMNQSLLAKWLFRFQDSQVQGLRKIILVAKYSAISFHNCSISSFWSGVLTTKCFFRYKCG
jgi:hypothetical protein